MFRKNLLTLLLLFIAFFINLKVFSQANNSFFQSPQILPSGPEASALYKVSDLPMDYSSGIANISIPIYTVKDGNISVPISISYNTSGIKVQDVAGSVGLGWNLNYDGIITVKRDFSSPSEQVLTSEFKQVSDIQTGNQMRALAFCGNVAAGQQEKQTPLCSYRFGKYSGTFL
jgi:hypothetical protein